VARTPVSNQTRPVTGSQAETRQPPLFKVLMHNDDYTTMEFVVEVLQGVFHKSPTEADSIMLHVHFNGIGVCGVYPFEIAEMKVARVHALARTRGYPLRCSVDRI
jgi:ATP-dependent Clp protease adaptor protein ClpS